MTKFQKSQDMKTNSLDHERKSVVKNEIFYFNCNPFILILQALQKAGQIISEIRETHVW